MSAEDGVDVVQRDMDCATARRWVVVALSGDAVPPAVREDAESHVLSCGACGARVRALARAASSASTDEMSCAEFGERIVAAATLGPRSGDAELDASATAHAAACPSCARLRDDLLACLAALEAGALPQPGAWPAFDTSFAASLPPRHRLAAAAAAALLERWRNRLVPRRGDVPVLGRTRDPSTGGEADRPRREGLAIVGVLVPVAVVLLLVLAVTWTGLQSTRPLTTPVPPRATLGLADQETATAAAARTPGRYGPPARPTVDRGIGPARRPSPTTIEANEGVSPTPIATRPPAPASRSTRNPGRVPVAATSVPGYPPPPAEYPTSGYPAPASTEPGYPPPRPSYGPGGTSTPGGATGLPPTATAADTAPTDRATSVATPVPITPEPSG